MTVVKDRIERFVTVQKTRIPSSNSNWKNKNYHQNSLKLCRVFSQKNRNKKFEKNRNRISRFQRDFNKFPRILCLYAAFFVCLNDFASNVPFPGLSNLNFVLPPYFKALALYVKINKKNAPLQLFRRCFNVFATTKQQISNVGTTLKQRCTNVVPMSYRR